MPRGNARVSCLLIISIAASNKPARATKVISSGACPCLTTVFAASIYVFTFSIHINKTAKGILLRRVKIEDDGNVMKSLCRMIAKAFTVFGGENGWPELFTYIRDFLENPTKAEIRAHVSNSVKKTVRRAINSRYSIPPAKGILLRRVKIEDDGNVMKSLCRMIAKAFTVFGGENGWPELFTYIRDFLEEPTSAILLKKLLEEPLTEDTQFHQVKHILSSRVLIEDDGNVMKSFCRTIAKAFTVFGGENGWPKLFPYILDFLEHPTNVEICATSTTREEGQHGNSASISAATGISDLGQVLQQKTFTRSEIERLKALLHSNPYCSPSSLLRLEASTSGSLKKHGDERDNLHAITTPMVTSRDLEEEIASPVELAKAYMGSRPSKAALRQDLVMHNNATGFLKSPNTLIASKIANGFTTPRSRGRLAMYNMAHTPYARSPSTFTEKVYLIAYLYSTYCFKIAYWVGSASHLRVGSCTKQSNRMTSCTSKGKLLALPWGRTPRLDSSVRVRIQVISKTTREEGQHGISAATGISDLEQVLQQKTFTRLEASTSGSLKKHRDERDNLHAISTPMVLEEEIASPVVELEKAYMGSRPSKAALRQDLCFHALCLALKRKSSILDDDIRSGGPLRRTRQKANLALKRRSSVLDDDIGSVGPLRRIRQKANLLMLRDKRELGYTALQQPDHASLLLMNDYELKIVKGAEKIETQACMALRSLEKVDSPKLLSYPHDNQKSKVQHHERLHDSRELTSKGKEKFEENGPKKYP
ncbi:nuclear pore complex protein NUP1-like protein isoform X2, partial [Tanacetum coccineum]